LIIKAFNKCSPDRQKLGGFLKCFAPHQNRRVFKVQCSAVLAAGALADAIKI